MVINTLCLHFCHFHVKLLSLNTIIFLSDGKLHQLFSEKLRAENEALAHKMRQEAENRAKRDAEIKAELDQSRNNNKSEILELFDRVKRDLEQRKVDTGNYLLASKI